MELLGLVLNAFIALHFGAIAAFLLHRVWMSTTAGLGDAKLLAAFSRALMLMTLSMSVLTGVGPIQRSYSSKLYNFPPLPDSFTEVIGLIYNTGFAVAVGIYPIVVVAVFSSFVLQVGLTRARLGK